MATRSILHVIPAVAARYGGPSAAVLGMCRALATEGSEVLIVTTDADGPGRLDVPLGSATSVAGVPTMFFRRQATEAFKWSAPLASWLRRHVAEFDVVHAHAVFSHSPIAAARACNDAGVPYVVRPLGTLDPWSVSRKSWRKRALWRLGARGALRGAGAIHYTTTEEQRLVEAQFSALPSGVVIPIGVDEAYFHGAQSSTSGAPYALVLSRLDVKKRIERVIHVWHQLCAGSDLGSGRLVIAGAGDPGYVDRLRALAAAGPAAGHIDFRGWVSGDEKLALVRGAALFLLASHQENFGVAMVEAMAAGVPAVVTPGVNLAEEIEAAGAGWRTGDTPEALSATVAHALRHDDERRQRGQRARVFAERFRWAVVGRQLVDLYDRLAPTERARSSAARVGAAASPAL